MSTPIRVNQFKGKWVYRSLVNSKVLNTPFNDLEFGLGTIDFNKIVYGKILDSTLDMGSNLVLNLEGEISTSGGPISFTWRGRGVSGSPTAGWIYDYQAYLAPTWKKATDKTAILIGSVLRAVPHNGAPAGVTGTFYMVKAD